MDASAERNLILRISKYGLEKNEFTIDQLYKDLEIVDDNTKDYIWKTLTSDKQDTSSPNQLLVLVKGRPIENRYYETVYHPDSGGSFRITPTALYNYIDYMEIIEARKSAKQAYRIAMASIILTAIVGVIQIIIDLSKP